MVGSRVKLLIKKEEIEHIRKRELFQDVRDQFPPSRLGGGGLAPVLASGLSDMTAAAQCLESVHVERVLPRLALQWRDVVAFQTAGLAALDTAPAVALEDGAADGGPAPGVQADVVAAQRPLSTPLRSYVECCRGGFGIRGRFLRMAFCSLGTDPLSSTLSSHASKDFGLVFLRCMAANAKSPLLS